MFPSEEGAHPIWASSQGWKMLARSCKGTVRGPELSAGRSQGFDPVVKLKNLPCAPGQGPPSLALGGPLPAATWDLFQAHWVSATPGLQSGAEGYWRSGAGRAPALMRPSDEWADGSLVRPRSYPAALKTALTATPGKTSLVWLSDNGKQLRTEALTDQ